VIVRAKQAVKAWVTLVLSVGFGGCMSRLDSVVADVNPTGWGYPVPVVYANSDTLALKELALVVRYDEAASAGEVVVEARSPAGATARDTIWLALTPDKTSNNIREARLPFRRKAVLGDGGEYLFIITPLAEMRGVWSVGIDFKNYGKE
jgi:hypothetical protein